MNIPLKKVNNITKITDEVDCGKENRKNIVNPIVPVAQFEAFKVYEDANYDESVPNNERPAQAEHKPKYINKIIPQINQNDRIRKEVMEIERQILDEKKMILIEKNLWSPLCQLP